jgi:hypothetical protein
MKREPTIVVETLACSEALLTHREILRVAQLRVNHEPTVDPLTEDLDLLEEASDSAFSALEWLDAEYDYSLESFEGNLVFSRFKVSDHGILEDEEILDLDAR